MFHPEQDLDGNRERIDYRDGEASWFTLPTGSYYVTAQSDLATRGQLVEVAVGKDRDAVTDLEAGRLRVSAVLAEGGEAIEGRHSIFLPEQGLDGDRERIAYRDGAASWFTVPAGTYYVGTEADLTHAGRLVEVFAGKDVGAVIALNAGRLRVAAKTADGVAISSQHSVYRPEENLDGQRERLDYRTGEARWFILPAGTYYVESQAGDLHAGREVQVVANATTDIVFDLPGNP